MSTIPKIDWDSLDFSTLTIKTAIWCQTEETAEQFIKLAYEKGYKWKNPQSDSTVTHFCIHEAQTVYIIDQESKNIFIYNQFLCIFEGYKIILFW